MTDDPKAGTTSGDDGDAALEPTTGTHTEAGRDAEPSDIAKLNMEWKAKAEAYNAERKAREDAERRLAEIEARRPSPAAERDDAADDDLSRYVPGAQDYAGRGDAVAGLSVAMAKRLQKLEEEREIDRRLQADREQLREIAPDPAYRKAVAEHYLKNQHRFGDPLAAHRDLEAERLAKELDDARKRLASYERKPTDVVRTEIREVPGSEVRTKKMTLAEFEEAKRTAPMFESLRLQRLYREGKIEVE